MNGHVVFLFCPSAHIDSTLSSWLDDGYHPHTEKQEGNTNGDKSNLVRTKTGELVVEHQSIYTVSCILRHVSEGKVTHQIYSID